MTVAAAARLEGSKKFSKQLMGQVGIPTAGYASFDDHAAAVAYVRQAEHPIVVKASGLAAGKGVVVPHSTAEAEQALQRIMLDREFGGAGAEVIIGGGCDDSVGYYIEPTVILAEDPKFRTMVEEIFGPVLTVHVYDDEAYEETLELCDSSSMYALTGAIIANDRSAASLAIAKLEHAAGNFYINDKPTGAVVGQQPFGGGRASGTNDKAGSAANLMRWVSTRTIKETFVPPTSFGYPFMGEE